VSVAILAIAVWLTVVLTMSLRGQFEEYGAANLFGIGAYLSCGGFVGMRVLALKSPRFLGSHGLRSLTRLQILRLYGSLALVLGAMGLLPKLFAIPTGVIDVCFAVTALPAAARLVSRDGYARRGFVAWHVAGLAGLGVSVATAILTSTPAYGVVSRHITSQPMSMFPMCLVPLFIGPLVLIFHLEALAQVFGNRRATSRENGTTFHGLDVSHSDSRTHGRAGISSRARWLTHR